MYGNTSVGVVRADIIPSTAIRIDMTTNVYGRRRASRTIHMLLCNCIHRTIARSSRILMTRNRLRLCVRSSQGRPCTPSMPSNRLRGEGASRVGVEPRIRDVNQAPAIGKSVATEKDGWRELSMANNLGAIPLRQFGRHQVRISALGFGGHHLGDAPDERTAVQQVRDAVDGGITFFDNC